MRQHLQEDRRDAADVSAIERKPSFFQARRGADAVTKAQEMPPIFLRIGIGKRRDARGFHWLFGCCQQGFMQGDFSGAGFRWRHQFRPGEEGAP